MKLFKKIIAFVVALAFCFTMTNHISTKAAVIGDGKIPLCGHDIFICTVSEPVCIDCEPHDYTYYTDDNNNDIPEANNGKCSWFIMEQTFRYSCPCGQVTYTETIREEFHSSCGK